MNPTDPIWTPVLFPNDSATVAGPAPWWVWAVMGAWALLLTVGFLYAWWKTR